MLLGISFPTISTYIYFDLLSNASPFLQKGAYFAAKLFQFLILGAALLVWRERARRRLITGGIATSLNGSAATNINENAANRLNDGAANGLYDGGAKTELRKNAGMLAGFLTGLVVSVLILAAYHFVLMPMGVMEPVKIAAKQKLQGLGADSPLVLLGIALFYAVLHSGFEELYWRGFVFRGLKEHFSMPISMACSSLGFMSHHIIVLAKYFGYGSAWTYLCGLGVAAGGAIWAALLVRYGKLAPGWLSHAMVDAAIFAVGYLLLFQ